MRRLAAMYIRGAVLIATVFIAIASEGNMAPGGSEKDPHRPQCSTDSCRKIKAALKSRYCGKAPFGNGPGDGCEIKLPKTPPEGISVIADFKCKWNETNEDSECKQNGVPSTAVREIILSELHRLGLPARDDNGVFFALLKPISADWSVAEGFYSRVVGSNLHLCEVIIALDSRLHVTVLRTARFQKTDVDVPATTTWSLIDIADIGGHNSPDIVLEGDTYENHWLEVISIRDSSWKTVFSGLGYYL